MLGNSQLQEKGIRWGMWFSRHTITKGSLDAPIHLDHVFLVKTAIPVGNEHERKENMQTPHRQAAGGGGSSTVEVWGCGDNDGPRYCHCIKKSGIKNIQGCWLERGQFTSKADE